MRAVAISHYQRGFNGTLRLLSAVICNKNIFDGHVVVLQKIVFKRKLNHNAGLRLDLGQRVRVMVDPMISIL